MPSSLCGPSLNPRIASLHFFGQELVFAPACLRAEQRPRSLTLSELLAPPVGGFALLGKPTFPVLGRRRVEGCFYRVHGVVLDISDPQGTDAVG